MLTGLAALHGAGMAHLDVKPPNVGIDVDIGMMRPDPASAVLLDFGSWEPLGAGPLLRNRLEPTALSAGQCRLVATPASPTLRTSVGIIAAQVDP